jgi:ESS family glutamate:Na+ symporter
VLSLDLVNTLAFAGLVLFLGYRVKRSVAPLARYNIPAPVVGGLLVAITITVARRWDLTPVRFDTTLQVPLMIAFFTSVGFGASLALLRIGGPLVILFFLVSTAAAVLQNVLGAAVAFVLGEAPLLGVLAGSVTLTGGPATGLAFAPLFDSAGVSGAATLAVAAAMVGIVSGGVIGGPIGTYLIERGQLRKPRARPVDIHLPTAANIAEAQMPEASSATPTGEDREAYVLLKSIVAILVAMWAGAWISRGFAALGATLPAYIGAMLAAAAIRNLDDVWGGFRLSQRVIDDLGSVSLSLFLVLALMTLRLWELVGLAVPLAIILVAQVALIALLCLTVVPRLMGRDYDGAVIASGFAGFMLGTTANSMANMEALVERYGPSPKAFLVVPMVGAFFIDFTNAIIITIFLNIFAPGAP